MSTKNRTHASSWSETPFGSLAIRSEVPGCRRPSIAEAFAEISTR